MKHLYEKLLEEYLVLLNNLAIGYPLTEDSTERLFDLIQVIDCIRFGDFNKKEFYKLLKKYE